MEKISNVFSKVSSQIKDTFLKFPITIILVYILTGIFVLIWDTDLLDSYTIQHIFFLGGLTTLGTFFVESNNKINKKLKYIGIGIFFLIAVVFDRVLDSNICDVEIVARWLSAYIISMILAIFYSLSKNSGVEFKEYILKLFSNIFKISIVYGVLNIGILLLSLAFIELILDGEGWSLVGRALMLLLGLFYIPAFIHSLSEMKVEVSKFIKGLILYVLLPLVSIGMVIIYMYIIKIIINNELPKNSVFAMLSAMFIFLYPICIMVMNYKDENKILGRISKILMYFYIPFIILEIYAISLRIGEYGLTQARYLACAFIVFQIVFIFLNLLKNSKYVNESIVFAIVTVILISITPFNSKRMSNLSQMKILEKYANSNKSFDKYTKEEKIKFAGAYEYLEYEDDKYMPDLTDEQKDELDHYYNYDDEYYDKYDYYEEYDNIYCRNELDGLDVSEYSKIYKLDTSYNNSNNYKSYSVTAGNTRIKLDLEEYVEDVIDADKNGDYASKMFFRENAIIETNNDDINIYLTYMSIEYNTKDDEIVNVIIDGYALQK